MFNKLKKYVQTCTYRVIEHEALTTSYQFRVTQGGSGVTTITTGALLDAQDNIENAVTKTINFQTTRQDLETMFSSYFTFPPESGKSGPYMIHSVSYTENYSTHTITIYGKKAHCLGNLTLISSRTESYWVGNTWYKFLSTQNEWIDIINGSNLFGGINYKLCVNKDDDLSVGTVGSAEISFETTYNQLVLGDSYAYYVKQPNDQQDRLIGQFIIDSVDVTSTMYHVVAYDYISRFDKNVDAWWAGLTFPITIGNLFSSLCTYCNCTAYSTSFTNSTVNITNADVFNGLTGRAMLLMIAQAAAGFIVCEPNGYIRIKDFTGSSVRTLTGTDYKAKLLANYDAPVIDQVNLAYSEDDIGVRYPNVSGTTYNQILNIYGNGLVNGEDTATRTTIATNIYNKVHTYQFTPGSVEMFEDLGINAGDKVTINSKTVFLFNKEMSNTGAEFITEVNATRDTVFTNKNAEINSLRGKYNILRDDVDAHYQELGDTEGRVTVVEQTSNGIKQQVTDGQGNYTVMTMDSGRVHIGNQSGEITIQGDQINAGNLNLTGRITFNDCTSQVQSLIQSGSNIKQTNPPTVDATGAALAVGQLWMCTGTPTGSINAWTTGTAYNTVNQLVLTLSVSEGTNYYLNRRAHTSSGLSIELDIDTNGDSYWVTITKNSWYSYYMNPDNVGTWELTSNPAFIKSTYIDSTTIMSPTIVGNDIIVNSDSGGGFKVNKNLSTVGFMGAGTYRDSSQVEYTGVIVSNDANGNSVVDLDTDYFMLATSDNIRLLAGASYIYINSNGAYVVNNGGTAVPLGLARFG